MIISHENLRTLVKEIVTAAGSTGDEPQLVSDNLVEANLAGHDSHGIGMLPRYVASVQSGELIPNQHAKIAIDNGPLVTVDGGAGYGQVIGKEAMDIAIDRVREHGVCVMTIRRSFHLGRIGAWGERCAAAGFLSMHHVNVVGHPGLVAPYRGTDARFATNPYCCTLPATTTNPPTVLDMATSVIAHGKIRVARNKGESLPDGILIDGTGQPTNNPQAMFDSPPGAIQTFGTYKGYGLALINELLAGVFSGGGTCRPENEHVNDTILNNMFSVIIDPERLVGKAFIHTETDATIAHVKASPALTDAEPVLVPGDPERASNQKRRQSGIPVDEESWRLFVESGLSVGVSQNRINALAKS